MPGGNIYWPESSLKSLSLGACPDPSPGWAPRSVVGGVIIAGGAVAAVVVVAASPLSSLVPPARWTPGRPRPSGSGGGARGRKYVADHRTLGRTEGDGGGGGRKFRYLHRLKMMLRLTNRRRMPPFRRGRRGGRRSGPGAGGRPLDPS